MSNPQSAFVWYEYMGDDLDAAAAFYGHVVGWTMTDSPLAGFPYKIASAGGHGVAGLLNIQDDAKAMGAPACWTGYIWVEDVDAALTKLTAAGGSAFKEPLDIPQVGRFAVVADPYGAMFAVFRDAGGNPPPPPALGAPGLVGWRELHAGDGAGALAFYREQFGWKKGSEFDMGPMGLYRLFDAGDGQSGGMMTKTPDGPGPCWLYYFNVEAIDAAVARVAAKGGRILAGPLQVPTGQWMAQGIDPEGAMFGLLSTTR